MARISDLDIMEIRQAFEDALSRAQKADKRQKMRLRRKIRDEVYLLLTWENRDYEPMGRTAARSVPGDAVRFQR
jgi:hypothetical protein